MADITFGDLIALIFHELSETLERTTDQAAVSKLHVRDVDLDIPAHLRLQVDSETTTTRRLIVTLPSTRETPPVGRLGRIRITIAGAETTPPEAAQ
jgi:hypothetical protein